MLFVNFRCDNCGIDFYVTCENLVKKSQVVCPNCEQKLSDEIFANLSNAMKMILDSRKIIKEKTRLIDNCSGYQWSYKFTDKVVSDYSNR